MSDKEEEMAECGCEKSWRADISDSTLVKVMWPPTPRGSEISNFALHGREQKVRCTLELPLPLKTVGGGFKLTGQY
jgi:hypothetical protein